MTEPMSVEEIESVTSHQDALQAGYDAFDVFFTADDLCPFERGDLRQAYQNGWALAFQHMGDEDE